MKDISIIVVACNVRELVDKCLGKVQAAEDRLKKQILYVDNGSSDGTVELVRSNYPEVEVIESEKNLGFIRANNLGYELATGRYVLMLNSDAFIGPKTLEKTVGFMDEHPEYGALGCRLIGRDGRRQPSARNFPTPWRILVNRLGLDRRFGFRGIDDERQDWDSVRECDWVPGCYLLARKAAVDQLDFFLRPDYFMYNDDNDLCLRLKRGGWKIVYFPEDVVHLGGENNKRLGKVTKSGLQINKYAVESTYLYFRKNYGVLRVLSLYLSGLLYHSLQLLKRILFFKESVDLKEEINELRLESRLLFETRLGGKAIH